MKVDRNPNVRGGEDSGQQCGGQRVDRLLDLVGDPAEALVATTPRVVEVVRGQRAAPCRAASAAATRAVPRAYTASGVASTGGSPAASTAASSRPNSPSTKVRAAASGRSATTYSCWSAVAVRTRSAASIRSDRSLRAANPSTSPPRDTTCRAAGGFISSPACQPPVPALWLCSSSSERVGSAPSRPSRSRTASTSSRSAIGERQMLPMHTCRTVNGGTQTPRSSRMSGTTSRSFSNGTAPWRSTPGTSPVRSTMVLGTGAGAGPASR